MQTDVLIIGCGIAGATAALQLAQDRTRQIVMLTRAPQSTDSNSSLAQGGIVTRGVDDTAALLVSDVLNAGDGLSYPLAVELLADDGPRYVRDILIDKCQMRFDQTAAGELVYGLEAAHSRRRILHVGDATGWAIMQALLRQVLEQPNIKILSGHTAVDLITFPHHATDPLAVYQPETCHGAYVLDQQQGEIIPLLARQTILATGGLGQLYLHTSNPVGARGDGLAMAFRAGARVANTEYIQFHPTTLHMPGTTKFLISEAVRGEGGLLLTPDGDRFMARYSPDWLELAPRDEVARAIYWEMVKHDYPYVLLDIASQKSPDFIRNHFPTIYARCLQNNIDITQQPIPVAPAAHYFCGGVLVDSDGHTSLPGLYAVGEVSCTGLHGANRLASTSLLEGLVWGARAALSIQATPEAALVSNGAVPAWDSGGLLYGEDPALIQGDMHTIRNIMWHYVGLVRSQYKLKRAIEELDHLWQNIEYFYRKTKLTDGLIGLRNACQAAQVVARAANRNRRSLGCHYREDSLT
jgi:L-aspartate oxidase